MVKIEDTEKTPTNRNLGVYFFNVKGKDVKELKVKNKEAHEFTFNDIVKFCVRSGGVSALELRKKGGTTEDL